MLLNLRIIQVQAYIVIAKRNYKIGIVCNLNQFEMRSLVLVNICIGLVNHFRLTIIYIYSQHFILRVLISSNSYYYYGRLILKWMNLSNTYMTRACRFEFFLVCFLLSMSGLRRMSQKRNNHSLNSHVSYRRLS